MTAAEKQLKAAEKNFTKIGKGMQDVGKNLSLAVTAPLVAFGVSATKAAAESRDAMAQVNASLQSMGPVAGKTSEELGKLGKELMRMSTYDDDEILRSVTANMLTFGNVAGDAFDRAQRAAVDMSTKLKTDLKSSTMLIGKALQDPIKGLTALTRVGVNFTEQQKTQIETMSKAGDAAGAQAVILGELEKQFKGSGKAARDAVPGSDAINAWADLSETIGETLLVALERIEPYINKVLDAFNNLNPKTQEFVTIGLALAAALGPVVFIMGSLVKFMAPMLAYIPVLYGMGVSSQLAAAGLTATGTAAAGAGVAATGATGSFAAMGAGLTTLGAGIKAALIAMAPVALVVAAIAAAGYLIYQNWDKIGPVLSQIGAKFQEAIGPKITELVDKVSAALSALWEGPIGDGIRIMAEFQAAYLSALGEGLKRVIMAAVDIISGAFDLIIQSGNLIIALFTGDWQGAWQAMKNIASSAVKTVLNVFESLAPGAIASMSRMVTGVKTWVVDKLNSVWKSVTDKVAMVKDAFYNLYDAVVGHSYIPDMVDQIGQNINRLQGNMVEPAKRYTGLVGDAFKTLQSEVAGILDRLFPEAAALNKFRDEQAKIDAVFKAGKLSAEQYAEAIRRLKTEQMAENTNVIKEQGSLITPELQDKIADSMGKFTKAANDNASGVEAANVRIVDSFKSAADATISALSNMANAIKGGGFLDILQSVIGFGLQLGSIGAFGKKIQGNINKPVPGFANGTNFAPGGLAVVGERGPELVNLKRGSQVIPNHKLGDNGQRQAPANMNFDLRGAVMTQDLLNQMQQMANKATQDGAALGVANAIDMNKRTYGGAFG